MKFRTSFQISRPPKEDGPRPTTSSHFKMPSLLEKRSKASLSNGAPEPKDEARKTPSKKTMQDFFQKTGANLRATGANLKATGTKLERRIPRRKSKVIKPSSKRNSQIHVRSYDIDEQLLDRIFNAPDDKQASAAFYDRQRMRAKSRKPPFAVSPFSTQSQADHDSKPLSVGEVEAMFTGAPLFKVQESHGKYKPLVEFQGGQAKTRERFPSDYAAFGHSSFAASTLRRSRSREHGDRPAPSSPDPEALKLGSDVVEIPSMLSAQGLDSGAVGFEHFLQLPISESMFHSDETNLEKRRQLRLDSEWLGLRELNMEHLISRLNELGELHTEIQEEQWESPAPWNSGKIEEMGEELFAKLLSAELGTTGAGTGSVTLKTQINALQRVLNTKDLWHDFSLVERRLKVGQLLWSSDEAGMRQLDENRQPSERDVLLLQITLAAELLLRLHALDALSSSVPPILPLEEAQALESQRTAKIHWDLVLAERFLNNINIIPKPPSESEKKGNRNSVFSAITFFTAKEGHEDLEDSTQPILTPKNEAEQLAGLVHFAEAIQWPHAQDVKLELQSKLWKGSKERPVSTAMSIYATPLSSPKLPCTPGTRTSYFGFADQKRRQGLSRTATSQSVQLLPARNIAGNVESFEVGGWLSRSYLSGLVMPGQTTSHFLISALLENSPQAITALGEEANLYGGFVYEGRSFWSKNCVVGRVLGASSGAAECMGWISVPNPQDMEEGWIELDIKQVPSNAFEPRIKDTVAVEKDSAPLHKQNLASVQAGDFTKPIDGHLVMGNEVKCDGLSFIASSNAFDTDNGAVADLSNTSIVSLTFYSPINSRLDKLNVPLTYDIYFVSSYPCHPKATKQRSNSKPLAPSPPLSFDNQENESSTLKSKSRISESNGKVPTDSKHASKAPSTSTLNLYSREKELPTTPAHPLHIDYHFDIIPVANLLSTPPENRPRALSSPTERKMSTATAAKNSEDIVILDCRGTEDLELLARAWCAKVGESALIGRRDGLVWLVVYERPRR